mgnify:CR=1 FL=1
MVACAHGRVLERFSFFGRAYSTMWRGMHWRQGRQCDSAMVKVAAGAQASRIEWEMVMFVGVCFVTD